jgi:hypothetical protein
MDNKKLDHTPQSKTISTRTLIPGALTDESDESIKKRQEESFKNLQEEFKPKKEIKSEEEVKPKTTKKKKANNK